MGKEYFRRTMELNWNGLERWSFPFKCTIRNASADNYHILAATETGTQEVNLEEGEMGGEECQRMVANICTNFVSVRDGRHS